MPKKESQSTRIEVLINGQQIEQIQECTFLGVILDHKLTWKSHIKSISTKISKSLGVMTKARKYFERDTLLTLYNTMIYPYLLYCNLAWGNTYKSSIDPLLKLQKRAVRIIMNLRRRESTTVFFGKLRILKMEDIYIFSGTIFMYKFINKMLPPMFDNFYTVNNAVHKYNTRQSDYLHTPIFKSFLGSSSIRSRGVKLWTDAVNNMSWKGKIGSFKTQLKIHILTKYCAK